MITGLFKNNTPPSYNVFFCKSVHHRFTCINSNTHIHLHIYHVPTHSYDTSYKRQLGDPYVILTQTGAVVTKILQVISTPHDDVIKWKHFPLYWPFVRGIHRSPVNSPHKGQWHGALMFPSICAWINGWVNNREAGNRRRHQAHYAVLVMQCSVVVSVCSREWPPAAHSFPHYPYALLNQV